MALPVHHGPSPRIFLLLLLPSISAQSASPPPPPPNSVNLITGILFITLIFALFFLGFFTAYLRRCFIRNQAISSNATVAAAAAAAFAAHSPANRRWRGLDPAAIESFPAIPYSSVRKLKPSKYGASNECSVCLGEFCDEEILRLLPGCRHVFHASCIDMWLESHVTCPVCRANLADPTVITAGQYLLDDLAEEQLADPVEIVVEVFRPELDPGPDPGPELEITPVPIYPDNVIKEIDFAKQHRRAASLVSFQKTRISTGAFGSFIRTLSVSGHNCVLLDPGEGSSKKIQMPRDDVAGRSGSTCSEKERSYEHSVTFTGFVLRGDVAEDDWLPEIFQISGAVQQSHE